MVELSLLRRRSNETPSDWGLRLLDWLTVRHQTNTPFPVERLLTELEGLRGEPEVVLDLIVGEWTLRQLAGERVGLSTISGDSPTVSRSCARSGRRPRGAAAGGFRSDAIRRDRPGASLAGLVPGQDALACRIRGTPPTSRVRRWWDGPSVPGRAGARHG